MKVRKHFGNDIGPYHYDGEAFRQKIDRATEMAGIRLE